MMAIRVKFLCLAYLLFFMMPLMAERTDYTAEEDALMIRGVNEVVSVLKREMKEKFRLRCTGSGGSMPYDIQEIGVDFLLCRQVSIEEARELEVRATERFVEIINSHEAIRPYLRDYPWDYHRAKIMVSFERDDGEDYPEGVSLVLQAKEKICYFGPEKSPKEIGPTLREPYLEAKEIVNSTPSCLKPVVVKSEGKKKKWLGLF